MPRLTIAVRMLGLLGALLMVVAEFTPLLRIRADGEIVATVGAGPHHGYALLVFGVVAAVLAWLATQPGAVRFLGLLLALVGAAAVFVVVAIDVPDLGADGAYGDITQPATSVAGPGFFLQSAGALLVLIAGGLLVLAPQKRATPAG